MKVRIASWAMLASICPGLAGEGAHVPPARYGGTAGWAAHLLIVSTSATFKACPELTRRALEVMAARSCRAPA